MLCVDRGREERVITFSGNSVVLVGIAYEQERKRIQALFGTIVVVAAKIAATACFIGYHWKPKIKEESEREREKERGRQGKGQRNQREHCSFAWKQRISLFDMHFLQLPRTCQKRIILIFLPCRSIFRITCSRNMLNTHRMFSIQMPGHNMTAAGLGYVQVSRWLRCFYETGGCMVITKDASIRSSNMTRNNLYSM